MNRILPSLFALALLLLSPVLTARAASPPKIKAALSVPAVSAQVLPLPLVEIQLDSGSILDFANQTASQGVVTRLPQIDILNAIYRHYEDDTAMASGRMHVILGGECFGKVYSSIEKIFHLPGREENGMFRSRERPPEIKYSNFHDIILFCRDRMHRIDINLNHAYVQELPYTFGARIKMDKCIRGRLRSGQGGQATEVVFDDDRSVLFEPPGFAFFIPSILTRIARIENRKGEMFGFVIGRPKSAPSRYMTVGYNLTTCAKSSIRTAEMSPEEFRRKLSDADFSVF